MDSGSAVPTLNPGLRVTVAEKLRTVARGRKGCVGGSAVGEEGVVAAAVPVPVAAFMLTRIARFFAADNAGRRSPASTAMMAITTISSSRVKAVPRGSFIRHLEKS